MPSALTLARRAAGAARAYSAAVPAVAQAAAKAAGTPLMCDPLAGVPELFAEWPSKAPETRVTKLPSGMIVASEDSPGPSANVSLFVAAGAAHETRGGASGATHVLEKLAFNATQRRSAFRVARDAEVIGAHTSAVAGREHFTYSVDGVKGTTAAMVEMLMEGARIPAMHDWEMTGAIERAVQDTDTAENAALKMSEAMHATAYGGKGLGRPLLATKGMINPDSAQAVANFWGEHFTAPSRMVVAGSGIDHDELLSLVEPFSGAVEGVEAQESGEYEEAPYVGGQWSTKSTDGTSHVNMVFETPGGWGDVDGAVTCTVMQAMLGGGFSFSSGGPGKGMYSRLYTGVLNNHHQISMASVHGEMYDKTGMVGVSGTCEPGYEGRLVDVLTAQLTDIAAGSFSDEELSRARNSAVSSMMTNLEKKSVVSEDIGRQMLTYGKRMPAQSFIDKIHKVTAKDVAAYAKKMYATPLTYITAPVADGAFPAYSDVQTRFK